MISCFIEYTIHSNKIAAFEQYAKRWIPLLAKFGGIHHGYFLPNEGANNKAYAIFSFESLAAYEQYRIKSQNDADCLAAYAFAEKEGCIQHYQRSFLKPLFQ